MQANETNAIRTLPIIRKYDSPTLYSMEQLFLSKHWLMDVPLFRSAKSHDPRKNLLSSLLSIGNAFLFFQNEIYKPIHSYIHGKSSYTVIIQTQWTEGTVISPLNWLHRQCQSIKVFKQRYHNLSFNICFFHTLTKEKC